jgi:hypothetical protein
VTNCLRRAVLGSATIGVCVCRRPPPRAQRRLGASGLREGGSRSRRGPRPACLSPSVRPRGTGPRRAGPCRTPPPLHSSRPRASARGVRVPRRSVAHMRGARRCGGSGRARQLRWRVCVPPSRSLRSGGGAKKGRARGRGTSQYPGRSEVMSRRYLTACTHATYAEPDLPAR